MDVKDAVGRARGYLEMVFADEKISEVRLEEVSFDHGDGSWLVTFGLLRPQSRAGQSSLMPALTAGPLKRDYKIVKIPNNETSPPSIRIREVAE